MNIVQRFLARILRPAVVAVMKDEPRHFSAGRECGCRVSAPVYGKIDAATAKAYGAPYPTPAATTQAAQSRT